MKILKIQKISPRTYIVEGLELRLLEFSLPSLVFGQYGLSDQVEKRRAGNIETRHRPEEHVLELEAPSLDQSAH